MCERASLILEIIALLPEKTMKYYQLTMLSALEITSPENRQDWHVAPWEYPLWTEEMKNKAVKRGVTLPWRKTNQQCR